MKTDLATFQHFLGEALQCAMQMMKNGSYILKQLPSLQMPDVLRQQLEALCRELIDTKYELVYKIIALSELAAMSPGSPDIDDGVEHMCQCINEVNMRFKTGVDAVHQAMMRGEVDGRLSLLLTESGVNIIRAAPSLPNFEGEADIDEDADEAWDWEDEENLEDPDCYAFHMEDSYPIGLLNDAISQLMERPDLQLETREKLKVFAFAMERLPLVTPGVRMNLVLRVDQGGESDWVEIRMEDGEFALGRGSWIDGDASTETVFEVSSGYREGDAFMATQFAESFAECASDACRELVIEDYSDEPFTGWHLEAGESHWGSLPSDFM